MIKSALSAVLLLISLNAFSQVFTIDPGHTAVTSKVQRFGMVDVLGRFNEVSGTIGYNEDLTNLSANVTIKATSYSSNNPAGEDAVKSPAFLDVVKYPEMKFQSTSIEQSGDQLIMNGKLTVHGITKDINFPFTFLEPFKDPTGAQTIAAHASFTINRQDFGIKFSRKLPNGKEFIGNEVSIELNVLAIEQ